MIYTAITGDKDEPRDDIPTFSGYGHFREHVRCAKIYKVLPHLYMDCDTSVWVDGNVYPLSSEDEIVSDLLGDHEMTVFRHPVRNSIQEEYEVCFAMGLDDKPTLWQQITSYELHYPQVTGLYECGVLIRRHTEAVKRLCERWWAEICRHSCRDQISFPVALHDCPVNLRVMEENLRGNRHFEYRQHKR